MRQGLMRNFLQNKAVVGLDLGSGAVKAVEWARGSVRACGFAPVDEDTQASAQGVTAAVREVLHNGGFRAGRAVVGLDSGEALMRQFRLPADLPLDEIEEQARIQAAQAAPYAVADACYDFRREGCADQQASYRMAIARSTVVEAVCRPAEEAGMKLAAVDLTSFAVQRTLGAASMRGAARAVVDGGHSATRLCVYAEGRLVFQHSQPFGCRELGARLRRALGLTPAECRKAFDECRDPGSAAAAIRDAFVNDFARHAARAFQLYLASGRDAPAPQSVLLWGGAALVHGARDALQQALAAPVEVAASIGEPAASVATEFSPALLGAYALAQNDHA